MVREFKSMQSLGLLGFVFDTGLGVTPLKIKHMCSCAVVFWDMPLEPMSRNMSSDTGPKTPMRLEEPRHFVC